MNELRKKVEQIQTLRREWLTRPDKLNILMQNNKTAADMLKMLGAPQEVLTAIQWTTCELLLGSDPDWPPPGTGALETAEEGLRDLQEAIRRHDEEAVSAEELEALKKAFEEGMGG